MFPSSFLLLKNAEPVCRFAGINISRSMGRGGLGLALKSKPFHPFFTLNTYRRAGDTRCERIPSDNEPGSHCHGVRCSGAIRMSLHTHLPHQKIISIFTFKKGR